MAGDGVVSFVIEDEKGFAVAGRKVTLHEVEARVADENVLTNIRSVVPGPGSRAINVKFYHGAFVHCHVAQDGSFFTVAEKLRRIRLRRGRAGLVGLK